MVEGPSVRMRDQAKVLPLGGIARHTASQEALKIMGSLEEEENKRVRSDSSKPWLQGPLSLSRQSCRFELPMDMRVLETMSPLQYVAQFCRVNSRRKTLFRHYFIKNDRDRDGIINRRELHNALRDLYAHSISTEQVNAILDLLDTQKNSSFTLPVFVTVAAFSERYLHYCYSHSFQESDSKSVLEETDFSALKWKLDGCTITPQMMRIFNVL